MSIKLYVIFGVAAGADCRFEKVVAVDGDFFFINFELNEGHEEGRDESGAHLEDIEVEKSIEDVCPVAVLLHLSKDFVGAHLEHLVHVIKEGIEIVGKVPTVAVREHQHRKIDEPVQKQQ